MLLYCCCFLFSKCIEKALVCRGYNDLLFIIFKIEIDVESQYKN